MEPFKIFLEMFEQKVRVMDAFKRTYLLRKDNHLASGNSN